MTLPESRNTFAESTVRKNGNVTNALNATLFNLTGKLIPRPVAPENTDVTVEPFSQGRYPFPLSPFPLSLSMFLAAYPSPHDFSTTSVYGEYINFIKQTSISDDDFLFFF